MDIDGFKGSFDKLWGYSNVVRYGTAKLGDDGCIVLVSGTPARKMKPGQVALSAVGGAVEALARAIAPEIAPKRINVVAPGIVDTPMVALTGDDRVTHYRNVTKSHLIKRPGKPEEIAKAILFAVENDFITGTTIDVDGDGCSHKKPYAHASVGPKYGPPKIVGMGWGFDSYFVFDADRAQYWR